MSKSNLHENNYLKYVFQNIAIPRIGDENGLQPSAVPGNLYVALFITNPTDQNTGTEATYISYTRQPVERSILGWSVTNNIVTNAKLIAFPFNTGTNNTITHFAVYTSKNHGDLIGSGALTSDLLIQNKEQPFFNIGTISVTED